MRGCEWLVCPRRSTTEGVLNSLLHPHKVALSSLLCHNPIPGGLSRDIEHPALMMVSRDRTLWSGLLFSLVSPSACNWDEIYPPKDILDFWSRPDSVGTITNPGNNVKINQRRSMKSGKRKETWLRTSGSEEQYSCRAPYVPPPNRRWPGLVPLDP